VSRRRVHVVYEHGPDLQPFGTAHVRLLCPLTHPAVRPALDVTFGPDFDGRRVDVVVLDRLWRPDVSPEHVERLLAKVRAAGARLVHALDDNFLDRGLDRPGWASRAEVAVLHMLVRAADGLIVSTERLGDRMSGVNPNIAVVPNLIDERLLDPRRVAADLTAIVPPRAPGDDRIVVGYMGTHTHDADLRLALPALREVDARHPGRLRIQLIGVVQHAATLSELAGLPVEVIPLTPRLAVYPTFLSWLTTQVRWDVAIAPLVDSPFTRAKSDIKFLDYAAMGAAGVYSRVPAYEGTVRHRETGWLAHNTVAAWVQGLDALISDADLRARMARAARSYVVEERTLAARGGVWVEAIAGLLDASGLPLGPRASSPPRRVGLEARGPRGDLTPPAPAGRERVRSEARPEDGKRLFEKAGDPAGRRAEGKPSRSQTGKPLGGLQIPAPLGASQFGARGFTLRASVRRANRAFQTVSKGPRVTVLYEYGFGGEARPLASGHLRLIRPFQHPAIRDAVDVTWSTHFEPHNVDAVILDRLWRPDVTMDHVAGLVERVRGMGAALIYALDDNLLDLRAEREDWPTDDQLDIVRWLLGEADGVLASSSALAARLAGSSDRVVVVPNALDERLLGHAGPAGFATPFGERPLVIGYMGTETHDDDLRMALPALAEVCRRHPGRVAIEVVGGAGAAATRAALAELPVRFVPVRPEEREYPLFMTWFTHRTAWDIAIAPLRDTPFRRCKSDIKFLDYCAIGAAGVYSRVAAYADSVRHGETGWLADNETEAWVEALERLIADEALRRHVGAAGRRYLWDERVLARRAGDWVDAVEGMLARADRGREEIPPR